MHNHNEISLISKQYLLIVYWNYHQQHRIRMGLLMYRNLNPKCPIFPIFLKKSMQWKNCSTLLMKIQQSLFSISHVLMDQQQLLIIFNQLKSLIKPYEWVLKPKFDLESKYDLRSFKDLIVDGRKRKEMYFVGLIIQSAYVGFYFMPIYTDPKMAAQEVFGPELLKCLKWKSCFHIKKLDDTLIKQITHALKKWYELYQQRGRI